MIDRTHAVRKCAPGRQGHALCACAGAMFATSSALPVAAPRVVLSNMHQTSDGVMDDTSSAARIIARYPAEYAE